MFHDLFDIRKDDKALTLFFTLLNFPYILLIKYINLHLNSIVVWTIPDWIYYWSSLSVEMIEVRSISYLHPKRMISSNIDLSRKSGIDTNVVQWGETEGACNADGWHGCGGRYGYCLVNLLQKVNLSHVRAPLASRPSWPYSTSSLIMMMIWESIDLSCSLFAVQRFFLSFIQESGGIDFGDGMIAPMYSKYIIYRNSLIVARFVPRKKEKKAEYLMFD